MQLASESRSHVVAVGAGDPARHAARPHVFYPVALRSEAVRLAPVVQALGELGIPQVVAGASEVFDADGVPRTERLVAADSRSSVERVARAMAAAEQRLTASEPDLVVVAGDGDAAVAYALTAAKLGIRVARLGAGLRCGDASHALEVNRLLLDRLADVLLTDGPETADALSAEHLPRQEVHAVGNTAIDLLRRWDGAARRRAAWRRLGLPAGGYVLTTLHREENTDEVRVAMIVEALAALADRHPIVLPLHPAMREVMEPMGDLRRLESAGIRVTAPLGYVDFLSLELAAGAILTDSGGVQDEAAALGVPCFTLRTSSERVQSMVHGTNTLLGDDPEEIADVRIGPFTPPPTDIPLWDGRAAERVAATLSASLS